MLFLHDSSDPIEKVRKEMPMPVGQLITPLTSRTNVSTECWAMDNGAYSGFTADVAKEFMRLLERETPNKAGCRFVAVPDVVGSARRTLEVFGHWYPRLQSWPLALVCQDGQEDLPIQWNLIAAVFIGGTDAFKLSSNATAIVRAAQAMGKWTHIGRVNTPPRIDKFLAMGADSIDGTGLSKYTHMRSNAAHPRLEFAQ